MSVPIILIPTSLSMARSPMFITGRNDFLPNDTLDNMTCNLRIYSGVRTGLGTNVYTLQKTYSINEVINFEVSDLVRTEFYHDFSIWNDIGYIQSPVNECLWLYPFGDYTYSNNGAAPEGDSWGDVLSQILVTDGWATLSNISPLPVSQLVLATPRNRYCMVDNYEVLALYNSVDNDFFEIEIAWAGGDTDVFYVSPVSSSPPDPTSNDTQDLVIYAGVGPANLEDNPYLDSSILPSNQPNGGVGSYYDVILRSNDGGVIDTVRYYILCESKYTPYQVGFVNRFGVADFITFFKRSDETGNFTQDSYQRSIYNDAFTTPSLEVGKYQSFNVNSRDSLRLNTGLVDESYSETIKDILMSEYVVVLINGEWISVVPQRGSVEYQKSVNEKVINYTMTFDFGFDERSLVR